PENLFPQPSDVRAHHDPDREVHRESPVRGPGVLAPPNPLYCLVRETRKLNVSKLPPSCPPLSPPPRLIRSGTTTTAAARIVSSCTGNPAPPRWRTSSSMIMRSSR